MEFEQTSANGHVLCLQCSPPLLLEWREAGRNRSRLMHPGDLSLLTHGAPHSARWRQGTADLLLVSLQPAFVARVLQEGQTLNAREVETEAVVIEMQHRKGFQDAALQHLCFALQAEEKAGYVGGRLFAEHLATAIALRLCQNYAAVTLPYDTPVLPAARPELRRALAYIHVHLDCDLSLLNIAGAAGLSVRHLRPAVSPGDRAGRASVRPRSSV